MESINMWTDWKKIIYKLWIKLKIVKKNCEITFLPKVMAYIKIHYK